MVKATDLVTDTDQDGLSDAVELQVFHTDPAKADTDSDGFKDAEEVRSGYNPNGPGRLTEADADQDGLSDRLEIIFGTDPLTIDSDGDGFADGTEISTGYSPTSTSPIRLEKSIRINLREQKLEKRVMGVALASFLVSTGKSGMKTPTGTFKILNKNPRAWSKMAKLWMPYWMQFSGAGQGIHELPEWPNGTKEGAAHLGKPVSHGCVRLGVGSAKEVYDWAATGTKVLIVAK